METFEVKRHGNTLSSLKVKLKQKVSNQRLGLIFQDADGKHELEFHNMPEVEELALKLLRATEEE